MGQVNRAAAHAGGSARRITTAAARPASPCASALLIEATLASRYDSAADASRQRIWQSHRTSPRTYDDCYKAVVVEMDDYSESYAVGGYNQVKWGDVAPSKSECADSVVMAYLFRRPHGASEWEFVAKKTAHGDLLTDDIPSDVEPPPMQPPPPSTGPLKPVPKDPGIIGGVKSPACRLPRVYFHTTETPARYDYKIAATARLADNSLYQVAFTSVAGDCGDPLKAGACCWAGEACTADAICIHYQNGENICRRCGYGSGQRCCTHPSVPECAEGFNCSDPGFCTDCGHDGEQCCNEGEACQPGNLCNNSNHCEECGSKVGQTCCPGSSCGNGLVCSKQNTCQSCGGRNELCCSNGCDSGLQCQQGLCKGPETECGAQGQACCAGSACDSSTLECKSGTCQKKPTDNGSCGGLGNICCAGNTCASTSLACMASGLGGNSICGIPPEPCSVVGSQCCPSAGITGTCSNKYYPKLKCNNDISSGDKFNKCYL